jgi:hypothetical protein
MEFPDEAAVDAALSTPDLPPLARVRQDPETPEVDDPAGAARAAVGALPLGRVPDGGTVGVGVGSRGIEAVAEMAGAVVDAVRERGFDPVVIPAMGSHGGATAEGQRRTLAELGVDEDGVGCPVDARMDTTVVGESDLGHEVPVATAAVETDGYLVLNRVKPHTNFGGRFESGLTKMATIGLGKRPGAAVAHEVALSEGYVPTIEGMLEVVRAETPLLGGIAVVENFHERPARVAGVPAADLPDAEAPLLEAAYEHMPTLPFDDVDVLVVERIGKDVSGAGMDTNVVGRYEVLNAADPATPAIDRIAVLDLTEATHGNGQGIGLADVTTTAVAEELDLDQTYTNALTSGSLAKARLPVALPTERQAVAAAVGSVGRYDPGGLRLAWIRDTGHLGSFRASPALVADAPDGLVVEGWDDLRFSDGAAAFEPTERPS